MTADPFESAGPATRLGRDPDAKPHRNLQAYVLEELGQLIVAGHVRPGEALPTEPELAHEFDVSKTVIREAVRGLAAKGMVEARTRLGTRVRPRDQWHLLDPNVLTWQLRTEPADELLRDLDEFRAAVEPVGARLAAERASREQLGALEDAIEAMRVAVDDPRTYFRADLDFHSALLAASGNHMFAGLRDAVRAGLRFRHEQITEVLDDMSESLPYHEAVVAAVVARDPAEATETMRRLMDLCQRDDARLRRKRRTRGTESGGGRTGHARQRGTERASGDHARR